MSRTIRWISLGLFMMAAPRATAQSAPPDQARPGRARLRLPDCEALPFDRQAFIENLQVELAASGVEIAPSSGEAEAVEEAGAAVITVGVPRCGAEVTEIEITIERLGSQAAVSHRLEVTEASGVVQSRLLALSIAELLRSVPEGPPPSPQEADPPPPMPTAEAPTAPGAARAQASPPRSAPQPALPERLGVALDVVVAVRSMTSYGGAQIGGRVAASIPLGRAPLRLAVDLGGSWGLAFDPLGSIELISATAGLSLLWSGQLRSLAAGLGPRVELGWGRLVGRPTDASEAWGDHADGVVSLVSLRGALRFRLHPRVLLLVDGQVGYVVAGLEARVEDRAAAGLGGPLIELGLGLSFEPLRRAGAQ